MPSFQSPFNRRANSSPFKRAFNNPSPPAPQWKGFLDLYPGAPFAYAPRKLRNLNTLCCRVRNDSLVEIDIGFSSTLDASGNYFINQTDLLNHCAGGNGFVVTRYDQTGNGIHETIVTAGLQPQIVMAGVVNKTLFGTNKPSWYFQAKRLLAPNGRGVFNNVPYAGIFAVYERVAGVAEQTIYQSSNGASGTGIRVSLSVTLASFSLNARRLDADAVTTNTQPVAPTIQQVYGEINYAAGTMAAYVNGLSSGSAALVSGAGNTSATNALSDPRSGQTLSSTNSADANLPEIIAYTANQAATRGAMIANQMAAYGII